MISVWRVLNFCPASGWQSFYIKVILKSVVFRGTDLQVTTAKLLLPSRGVPTSPDALLLLSAHQRGTEVTQIFEFC